MKNKAILEVLRLGLKIELSEVKNVIESVLEKMFKDEIKKKTYDTVTADAVCGMIFGELISVASREFEAEITNTGERTKILEDSVSKIEEGFKNLLIKLEEEKEECKDTNEIKIVQLEEGAKIGD